MKRYHMVLSALFKVIKQMEEKDIERDHPLTWEVIHISSCSRIAQLLARKRKADVKMCAIAAAVHDFGRIVTGKQKDHAENGYKPVKKFLGDLNIFDEKEVELLANACRRHSDKHVVGTDVEEIVKDSDILDCYLHGLEIRRQPHKKRLKNILKELDLE